MLGTEKEILSFIAVADEMRESSKEVIGKLNNMEIETVMLTGDNKERQQLSETSWCFRILKLIYFQKDSLILLKNFEKNIKVWGWSEMA